MSQSIPPQQSSGDFRLQIWNELSGILAMIATLLWVTPWYDRLLAPVTPLWIVAIGLAVSLIGSYFLARALAWQSEYRLFRRLLFGFYILALLWFSQGWLDSPSTMDTWLPRIGALLVSPGDEISGSRIFFHFLTVLLLVWRGVLLARYPFTLSSTTAGFRLGLLALILFGVGFAREAPSYALILFAVYITLGLSSLALGRVSELGGSRGGKLPLFSLNRGVEIVAIAAGVTLLALAAGWLFNLQLASMLAIAALSILSAVGIALVTILSPLIILLVEGAYRLGLFAFTVLDTLFERKPQSVIVPLYTEPVELPETAQVIRSYNHYAAAVLLIILVIVILITLRRRFAQRSMLKGENPSERALSSRFRPASILDPFASLKPFMRNPRKILAAARIRRIYSDFCDLCSRLGTPRIQSSTPLEYLPHTQQLFPNLIEQLGRITQAYVRVRYGLYPETNQEVALVEEDWSAVKKEGRRLLLERKRHLHAS